MSLIVPPPNALTHARPNAPTRSIRLSAATIMPAMADAMTAAASRAWSTRSVVNTGMSGDLAACDVAERVAAEWRHADAGAIQCRFGCYRPLLDAVAVTTRPSS